MSSFGVYCEYIYYQDIPNYFMKQIIYSGAAMILLAPMVVMAQFNEIDEFFGNISEFINDILIPLLFAVALLMFLWGVFKYFINDGDDDREEGKKYMIWAIAAFVVMVSVFGIVNLIAGGLGFSDDEEIDNIPNVPTSNR